MPQKPRRGLCHGGFTLVELLITIGIIGVLISILVPVVSRVRTAARTATSTAFISELSRAIDQYYQDFHAYPGPLANNEVNDTSTGATQFPPTSVFSGGFQIDSNATSGGYDSVPAQSASVIAQNVTMSENLVLGLLGGLKLDATKPNTLIYDPAQVGLGPSSLNTLKAVQRHANYIDPNNLDWRTDGAGKKNGHFKEDVAEANDTVIPEFVDTYTSPLPILYMRARVGVPPVSETPTLPDKTTNSVVTFDPSTNQIRNGMYDLHQVIGYTGAYTGAWPNMTLAPSPEMGVSIGEGKKTIDYYKNSMVVAKTGGFNQYHGLQSATPAAVMDKSATTGYQYPYDAYSYLKNPSLSSPTTPVPVQKDAYILISAGPDRIFGTDDDITNFGSVGGK